MHVDTPEQDTQNNWPVGATGFGLGTFAQPDPDVLAPAGTASAEAASTVDARTAKMTRSRTVRIGPPLDTPEPMLPSLNPSLSSRHGMVSTPAQRRRLVYLDVNKRAVASKDYRHTIPRACKDLRWEAGDLRITRVFPCAARGSKARPSFMFAGCCCWWRSLAIDGRPGTSRGHGSVIRRPGSRLTRAIEQPSAEITGNCGW
jgi:hypothetical protein